MEYTKYIDKFESAEAIQTAIDNGELNNPYVALDLSSNTIDWNSRNITPEDELIAFTLEWVQEHQAEIMGETPFVRKFYVYTGFTIAPDKADITFIGGDSQTNYATTLADGDINSVPQSAKYTKTVDGLLYNVIDFGELCGVDNTSIPSIMNFVEWYMANDSFYNEEGFYGIYLVQ